MPWYNLHKLFAGLRDAYLIGGNAQAREVLVALADWCATLVSKLSDEQMQQMLGAEHGGMNEVLADVSAITGDAKYLELAQRFSHRAILDPLTRREDTLTGLHANTQIPKVVGFARIAALGGDRRARGRRVLLGHRRAPPHRRLRRQQRPRALQRAGRFRADARIPRRPGDLQHLQHAAPDRAAVPRHAAGRVRRLLRARALQPHPLHAAPEHGGYVYFTPIRPRHYRVYSQPEECFWCCVGTGMENHGKYGQFIYAHRGDELFVNLFMPPNCSGRSAA